LPVRHGLLPCFAGSREAGPCFADEATLRAQGFPYGLLRLPVRHGLLRWQKGGEAIRRALFALQRLACFASARKKKIISFKIFMGFLS